MDNPWNIQSIYELQYFNCPSCIFKNSSKQEFIDHACEIHPESIDYLSKIFDDSLSDVSCPWRNFLAKVKQENYDEGSKFTDSLALENEMLNNINFDTQTVIKQEPSELIMVKSEQLENNLIELNYENSNSYNQRNEDPLNFEVLNPETTSLR